MPPIQQRMVSGLASMCRPRSADSHSAPAPPAWPKRGAIEQSGAVVAHEVHTLGVVGSSPTSAMFGRPVRAGELRLVRPPGAGPPTGATVCGPRRIRGAVPHLIWDQGVAGSNPASAMCSSSGSGRDDLTRMPLGAVRVRIPLTTKQRTHPRQRWRGCRVFATSSRGWIARRGVVGVC